MSPGAEGLLIGRKAAAAAERAKTAPEKAQAAGHAGDKARPRFSEALERALGPAPDKGPSARGANQAPRTGNAEQARPRAPSQANAELHAGAGHERSETKPELIAAKAEGKPAQKPRLPLSHEAVKAEEAPPESGKRRVARGQDDDGEASRKASLAALGAQRHDAEPKGRTRAPSEPQAESDLALQKKEGVRREAPTLTILDLRRSPDARKAAAKDAKAEEASREGPAEAIKERVSEDASGRREIVKELWLDPAGADRSPTAGETKPKGQAAPSSDFARILAERLHDCWNGDIVTSAHLVLKDGDSGVIRLRLRPDSLGSVKIELNLSEKSISGKIVVESDEAKTAFERNMNQLADAFKREGFESAKLEVSVGSGSGRGAGGSGDASGGGASGPFFSERLRTPAGGGSEAVAAASTYGRRGSALDLYA